MTQEYLMVDGHQPTAKGTAVGITAWNMAAVDPAQLSEMSKDDLVALAREMGVELPRGAAKALIVEKLASRTVQANANDGSIR